MKGHEQGIRITIDGTCHTGKTLFAEAFIELLKLSGLPSENITELNDNNLENRTTGPKALAQLKEAILNNPRCREMPVVFVERIVPRTYDTSLPLLEQWHAKPDLSNHPIPETPAFSLPRSQVEFEMTNRVPEKHSIAALQNVLMLDDLHKVARHMPVSKATPLLEMVMIHPEEYNMLVRLNELLKARLGQDVLLTKPTAEVEATQRFAMGLDHKQADEAVPAQPGKLLTAYLDENLVRRKYAKHDLLTKAAMTPEQAQAYDVRQCQLVVLLNIFLGDGLANLLSEYRLSWVTDSVGEAKNVLEVGFQRWDRQALTAAEGKHLETTIETKYPHIRVSYKLQNSSLSGSHAPGYGSTPLFDPTAHARLRDAGRRSLGIITRSLSDGHRAFEMPANVYSQPDYTLQVHPQTGETREQMLERVRSLYVATGAEGIVGLDINNLPVDLVFDPQCGVRWKTDDEMKLVQRDVDKLFETAQTPGVQIVRGADGEVLKVFVPTKYPRGMNPYFTHIDDAPFQSPLKSDVTPLFQKGLTEQATEAGRSALEDLVEARIGTIDPKRIVNADPTLFSVISNPDTSSTTGPVPFPADPVLKSQMDSLSKVWDAGINGVVPPVQLNEEESQRFTDALDQPAAPNDALKGAMEGFRSSNLTKVNTDK